MTDIQKRLFALQDKKYRDFTAKLSPTVDRATIIGVRQPLLRKLAKELKDTDEATEFLHHLPHEYLDEYHLHSFLISTIKDFDEGLLAVEQFLPYIDNWGVCDGIRIKGFEKAPERLLPHIERWLKSDHTYTVRYGILCLMVYFLNENFDPAYPEMVAAVQSEEYYIRMMQAWYFATALAKQYDAALPFIEERRLEPWTHNKTIQKAVESFRVTDEHKAYLKTLKIK